MESDVLAKEKRGNVAKEIAKLAEINDVETELQNIDLYKLLKVYQRSIEKFDNRKTNPHHQVVQYPYTIADQKDMILDRVQGEDKLAFVTLIRENQDKIAVIFNFLSILELLQLDLISIKIGEGYNNFWITSKQ